MTAWASALALLRRFWPAIPIVIQAGMLLVTRGQLADTRQTLTNERQAWTASLDRADSKRAEIERDAAQTLAAAASTYAAKIAARAPLIIHSTNTVREYAQTDAGRAVCLGADRVRGIDALDAALADPHSGAAGGRDGAVHPNAGTPPVQR